MAAPDYMVITDIKNRLWAKLITPNPEILQEYIDSANVEIEDIAIRKNVPVADIMDPIHSKLKLYATNFALQQFAADRIGMNVRVGEVDVYDDLFKRSQYLINMYVPQITESVLTGVGQTNTTRSVSFGTTQRG